MKKYQGSCHCGAVAWEAEAEIVEGLECNCSHCSRKGFLLAFIPEDNFELKSGEDNLTQYNFNKHMIDHEFCQTCGVQSFSRGSDDKGNVMVALNLRCIPDLDLSGLKINKFDGASY